MRQPEVNDVAAALQASIGLFLRRLGQSHGEGELTLSERSALARLGSGGPTTPTALARVEQITPQSIGATLAALEARGLVERRPHPEDGRRVVMSLTEAGLHQLHNNRNARTEQLAQALSVGFTRSELKQLMAAAPLIERLASTI